MTPRKSIRRYAARIESKLRQHDDTRGDWRDIPMPHLFALLRTEMRELLEAVLEGDPEAIADEAADVGAYASFIADAADKSLNERRGR